MRQNRLIKIAITLIFTIINMVAFGQAKPDEFSFMSFEMEKYDSKIVLNWTANDGGNSNYFEVERSSDGKKFKTIMVVLGSDPSKNGPDKFESAHKVPTKNKAYYRLKHINSEGIITFSSIKSPDYNY